MDLSPLMRGAGSVSAKVVQTYIQAMGGWPRFSLLMLGFIMAEVARISATVWLSHWTSVADLPGTPPRCARYSHASGLCPVWRAPCDALMMQLLVVVRMCACVPSFAPRVHCMCKRVNDFRC